MRVPVAVLAGVSALLVAGCGSQGVVLPTANGVSGTLPTQPTTPALAKGDPIAGKKLFTSEGCTGCHTYGPAGSHGTIGPDLDKLAQYAKEANLHPAGVPKRDADDVRQPAPQADRRPGRLPDREAIEAPTA